MGCGKDGAQPRRHSILYQITGVFSLFPAV
jgi:hypothetical protein